MRRNSLILSIIFFRLCFGQEEILSGQFEDFYIDHHKHYYTLDINGTIKKYNSSYQFLSQQNLKIDRDLSYMYVANPMNLLTFYRDQQKIRVYDNFLNVLNLIDLNALALPEIEHIALSFDNQIWAIDGFNKNLYKISLKGKLKYQLENLSNYNIFYDQLYWIKTNEQQIVLSTDQGLYFLDQFGQFIKKIPLTQMVHDIHGQRLIFSENNTYFLYNTKNFSQQALSLPYKEGQKLIMMNNQVFILRKNGVDLYDIK